MGTGETRGLIGDGVRNPEAERHIRLEIRIVGHCDALPGIELIHLAGEGVSGKACGYGRTRASGIGHRGLGILIFIRKRIRKGPVERTGRVRARGGVAYLHGEGDGVAALARKGICGLGDARGRLRHMQTHLIGHHRLIASVFFAELETPSVF